MYKNVKRCERVGGVSVTSLRRRSVCTRALCSVHSPSSSCFVTVDGKVPAVYLYKEMDDALDRGNYRGLKLTEQAMKVIERIAYSLVKQVMTIDLCT